MQPREKEQSLIQRYLLIEDVQERLALIVDRARKLPRLPDSDRTLENLVKGCSSRVWIAAALAPEGRCAFQVDADSTLVKGLVTLLCEIYQGALPAEVAAFEPTVLEALHLTDHLTLTRRHGLAQARKSIREFAERAAVSLARG